MNFLPRTLGSGGSQQPLRNSRGLVARESWPATRAEQGYIAQRQVLPNRSSARSVALQALHPLFLGSTAQWWLYSRLVIGSDGSPKSQGCLVAVAGQDYRRYPNQGWKLVIADPSYIPTFGLSVRITGVTNNLATKFWLAGYIVNYSS